MAAHDALDNSTPSTCDSYTACATRSVNTITVVAGPEARKLTFDEDIICQKCSYFSNAISGGFLEAQTKIFTFPEDDSSHWSQLQSWLHDQTISSLDTSWIDLVKLWVFANKYGFDDFQNAIIDALYTKHAAHQEGLNISFTTLDHVVEHTSPRSPIRRMFADMLCNGISLQQLPDRVESIPAELLQEMFIMLKSQAALNGPSNISLLTNPLTSYYVSSAACKATATPKQEEQVSKLPEELHCDGDECERLTEPVPVGETIHVCSNHNITLCGECRHTYRGHRKKTLTLVSPPYCDPVLGSMTVVDAQINDSGFYCDGPKCDTREFDLGLPHWALMSGDRYHCLACPNKDYCSICVRGQLDCKDLGHAMLRIRPTYCRKTFRTEQVPIIERQRRLQHGLCVRCGGNEHQADVCTAKGPVLPADIPLED